MGLAVGDLRFEERPLHDLLNLAPDRLDLDPDYLGAGWARAEAITLVDERGGERLVRDALVLGLHGVDDGEPVAGDIDLYFEPEGQGPVTVRLSVFLSHWLPRLPSARGPLILALCNFHDARLGAAFTKIGLLYYAMGEVTSRQSLATDEIELCAPVWLALPTTPPCDPRITETTMSITSPLRPGAAIDDATKQTYVGLWLLKKLDLPPEEGGMSFSASLSGELGPLDEVLQELAVEGKVQIHKRRGTYELTQAGIDYLGMVIDEASDLVDELDDLEPDEAIAELRARGLDVFRARYLWGWFSGEFDDLVLWQEQRGVRPVESLWAFYLTGDAFWSELARELRETAG